MCIRDRDCADKGIPVVTFDTGIADAPEGSIACEVCTDNAQAGSVAAENMYNAIKDVVANADGQVVIGEVNQDATAQNIQPVSYTHLPQRQRRKRRRLFY